MMHLPLQHYYNNPQKMPFFGIFYYINTTSMKKFYFHER